MRIVSIDQWGAIGARTTVGDNDRPDGDRDWIGVAIGPRSDEGRVLIDGYLLQAGRPLALRNRHYQVSRATPATAELACIRYLELMLLEDPAELAMELARPNLRYSDKFTAQGVTHRSTFPYVARRQARVLVTGANGDSYSYKVYGLAYSEKLKTVEQVLLEDGSAGTPIGADKTAAFYIGGTDNAECWDALAVDTIVPAEAPHTWTLDVETIGELGVR